eukprot:TRINITY_DN36324_c0_g1_i1.p1 TRINITY_DN36324_c0_g1~~TRINITY_DN36324_c0_g1_i1.p1  ORF type:complete len:119 (-),score=32.64 TRINITY_DN36324_c0_g1_i1:48-404(-)
MCIRDRIRVMTGACGEATGTVLPVGREEWSAASVAEMLEAVGSVLAEDQLCAGYLPLELDGIGSQLSDGVLYSRMLHAIDTSLIDERAVSIGATSQNLQHSNLNLVITATRNLLGTEL